MHSPRADRWRTLALALALAACVAAGARAQDAAAPAVAASAIAPADDSPAARAARIDAAVATLAKDPLLSGKRKVHRLREIDDDAPRQEERGSSGRSPLADWFAALFDRINEASRFLVWGLVLVGVALALVSLRHVIQLRAFRRTAAESAVSHVRDLDVRPESLPDDVGAAAWALWQAGKVPAALSLLYRGALSRMIHRFAVPITSSATEGECLALASGRLEAPALRYVTQVVRAWEANTYGGRGLSLAMGEALCGGFAARLDVARPVADGAPT